MKGYTGLCASTIWLALERSSSFLVQLCSTYLTWCMYQGYTMYVKTCTYCISWGYWFSCSDWVILAPSVYFLQSYWWPTVYTFIKVHNQCVVSFCCAHTWVNWKIVFFVNVIINDKHNVSMAWFLCMYMLWLDLYVCICFLRVYINAKHCLMSGCMLNMAWHTHVFPSIFAN